MHETLQTITLIFAVETNFYDFTPVFSNFQFDIVARNTWVWSHTQKNHSKFMENLVVSKLNYKLNNFTKKFQLHFQTKIHHKLYKIDTIFFSSRIMALNEISEKIYGCMKVNFFFAVARWLGVLFGDDLIRVSI